MKKPLLFISALFVGLSAFNQNMARYAAVNERAQSMIELNRIEAPPTNTAVLPAYIPHTYKGSNMDVKKVFMGTSRNVNSLLVDEQNCMYYNKALNAVMGTYRGNDKAVTGLPAPLGTGNQICTYWSADKGATFTGKVALAVTGSNFRYPSGVIYNPTGNTDISTAYSVVAGPQTVTAWDNTFLSSVQYNGNNFDVHQPATSTYKELVRNGMCVGTDGNVHIASMKYATDYKTAIGMVYNGVFNSNTFGFDWAPVDVTLPFNVAPDATLDAFFGSANMAWSKDGSIGYLMYRGVDSRATGNKSMAPILFKSVDKGLTWQLQDYFDYSVFPVLAEHIWPTLANPALYVPYFSEADLVVDAAGNPHIMALCQGQYSQHPDSLGYTFKYENGNVFEFSFEHGQWFCHYVAHNRTRDVAAADSPYIAATGNVGWNMRLQASVTDDGSKVFALWTDTDWAFWGMTDSLNLYPDVMAWSRDVNTNWETAVKNITYLQEGMGESHFLFVSPVAMDNAGVYDVPISISDINTSSLNADEPIAHYYLQGVTFVEADYFYNDIAKSPPAKRLSVDNYPNPFTGITKIDFNLDNTAPVSLVVNSLTGQQVSSVNYGSMSTGSHTLTFDATGLAGGIYFYTLTIGDQKATGKMVIK